VFIKIPMNQTVKTLWIDALRSGNYKQGVGCLYNPKENTYCSLGVLCHLHHIIIKNKGFDESGKYLERCGVLPIEVIKWAGLEGKHKSTWNDVDPTVNKKCLTEINDKEKKDFSYIANEIEKYL
jgi:hypothetical protein